MCEALCMAACDDTVTEESAWTQTKQSLILEFVGSHLHDILICQAVNHQQNHLYFRFQSFNQRVNLGGAPRTFHRLRVSPYMFGARQSPR
ncbi:hypothetical protein PoB_006520500 [Plakobranchus ocellatus]|uniref:Uncharacterized protein n=1 Tax=Plakobranchus ocellatus TaxID=259542 RepID=A0AAV4D3Z4_9GAST|nr:hypothetical protein PoB_006520500 [Plakobranchus ocellatus]